MPTQQSSRPARAARLVEVERLTMTMIVNAADAAQHERRT